MWKFIAYLKPLFLICPMKNVILFTYADFKIQCILLHLHLWMLIYMHVNYRGKVDTSALCASTVRVCMCNFTKNVPNTTTLLRNGCNSSSALAEWRCMNFYFYGGQNDVIIFSFLFMYGISLFSAGCFLYKDKSPYGQSHQLSLSTVNADGPPISVRKVDMSQRNTVKVWYSYELSHMRTFSFFSVFEQWNFEDSKCFSILGWGLPDAKYTFFFFFFKY